MRIKYVFLLGLILSVLAVPGVRAEEAQSADSKIIERGTQINGDVVVNTGDLIVRGHVCGSVIATTGNILLESSARVEGDAVARQGRIIVSPGARVSGNMVQGHVSDSKAKISRDKSKGDIKIRDKQDR
jgi:cytoskeletal protein CcmA (bactofilin family)